MIVRYHSDVFYILLHCLSSFALICGFSRDIVRPTAVSILTYIQYLYSILHLLLLLATSFHHLYVDKGCFIWAYPFGIVSFLAMLFPWSALNSLLVLIGWKWFWSLFPVSDFEYVRVISQCRVARLSW